MEYMDYMDGEGDTNHGTPALMRLKPIDPLLQYTDEEFRDRFRMGKACAIKLHDLLRDSIEASRAGNYLLSPMLQILVALRFYGDGSFLRSVGDIFNISDSSVSHIVHRVSKHVADLRSEYIKFPSLDQAFLDTKKGFYDIAHFPGVVGCIDGTHIPIIKPASQDYEEHRCRKGYFSIIVQAVNTHDLQVSNLVVRWRGATHDSRIWNNCSLNSQCESDLINGYLLGDNGYACTPYVLTPLLRPSTPAELRYNRAHISTRNSVERLFGVWKSRFQCLRNTLRFRPLRCCRIFIATAVLHNFVKQNGEEDMKEINQTFGDQANPQNEVVAESASSNRRQFVIETHFSH